jgi:hypothetical protein
MKPREASDKANARSSALSRRNILLAGSTLVASALGLRIHVAQAQQPAPPPSDRRPNILVIFGRSPIIQNGWT